ncbi:MAG TPA: ABC transporter ATP-binding protein [Candidatus Ozemobacteraceae bacterium]|nr:ABC transporter ATP-binding protein [Candidatus Ozemobacteraceae bacterium]
MNNQHAETQRRHPRWYYVRWIARQYQGHGLTVLLMLVLTLLATTAAVLLPQLLRAIIDQLTGSLEGFRTGRLTTETALAERNRSLLLLLALGFGPVVGALYPWLRMCMNLWFERLFRERYLRTVLGREAEFFLRFQTGDLVTRLTDNLRCMPSGLPWLCCSGIFRAVTAAGIILCCLIGMFSLHGHLALAALVPLPCMLWLFLRLQTTMEKRCEAVQERTSETTTFLETAFTGIRILKSFTAERPRLTAFRELLDRRRTHEMAQARTEGLFQVYFELLTYLGEVLVLVWGGLLVVRGELSIGSYYAFFSYLGMILPTVMDIPMLLVTLSQSFVIIDRLEALQATTTTGCVATRSSELEVTSAVAATNVGEFQTLDLRGVEFAYPGQTVRDGFRLQHVSFTMRAGEKVAIMGAIGSGKSTLLQVVAGLLEPTMGQVHVNGQRLSPDNSRPWREQIGFVQQEPVLFSESVADNIDFWRGYESDRLEWAAELAQIRDEIGRLPGGYTERLGARGAGLSGGQRQRLALARALAGRPRLLLMDDVTAGLDAENERRLWRRLRVAAPDLACLIVTHRAATARIADRILVLDRGRLVATGTHAELARSCPLYRRLAGLQETSNFRRQPLAA